MTRRRIAIDDAYRAGMGRKEAFTPQAVDSLWTFLKEAQLISDRRVVDPDLFYWLHPLYDLRRIDILGRRNAKGGWMQKPKFEAGLLFRKASQMGASVWSIVFMLWLCIDLERPLGIACYWPTEKDLQDFIQTRLDPMIEACPKLQTYMEDTKVDSTRAKQIGRSTIYFRYVAGKASADSIPIDILLCDEVRLWGTPKETIQRLKERLGQSDVKFFAYFSTVGSQGDFMEAEWANSNQIKYFSRCAEGCLTEIAADPASPNRLLRAGDRGSAQPGLLLVDGVVLSDHLPDEIVRVTGRREAHYICPCCHAPVHDPADGRYVETRPEAEGMYALEFARTLSPRLDPYELLKEYKNAKDMKQFMNGYLAKPWLDPEGRPVKEEDWSRARDAGLEWAEHGEGLPVFLGGDFRAREFHYVLLSPPTGELGEDGKPLPGRILRVGVYQHSDWEAFLERLILAFQPQRGILDYLPFTSHVLAVADRHEGRIFLAQYRSGPMIKTVAQDGKGARKISPDGREKHMVMLDQVKSLNHSLTVFARGHYALPAGPLYQTNFKTRKKDLLEHFDVAEGAEGDGREGFKQHLMGLALVTKRQESTNNSREKANESGLQTQEFQDASGFDPHWAHAYNYAVMATLLDGGGATLIGTSARHLHPAGYADHQLMPGVPVGGRVAGSINAQGELETFTRPVVAARAPTVWTCGHCESGPDEGRAQCAATGLEVHAREPRCTIRGLFKAKRVVSNTADRPLTWKLDTPA